MGDVPAWSPEALDALRRLHACDWLLFVEGGYDVAFWRAVLESCGVDSFQIKVAGDDKTLARYARAIAEDRVGAVVVAGDRDYRPWVGEFISHDRVIYTFGYSAENTLYAAAFVTRVVEDLSGKQDLDPDDFDKWLEEFCAACKQLVVLDLADRIGDSGLGPLGRNCARFLSGSLKAKAAEITRVQNEVSAHLPKQDLLEAESLLQNDSRPLCMVVRGHFLTHAVLRYVSGTARDLAGRKMHLSNDSLRAMLVSRVAGPWPDRDDLLDLRDRVDAAFAAA